MHLVSTPHFILMGLYCLNKETPIRGTQIDLTSPSHRFQNVDEGDRITEPRLWKYLHIA